MICDDKASYKWLLLLFLYFNKRLLIIWCIKMLEFRIYVLHLQNSFFLYMSSSVCVFESSVRY